MFAKPSWVSGWDLGDEDGQSAERKNSDIEYEVGMAVDNNNFVDNL